MEVKEYISAIAIEHLLADDTLPDDIRYLAEKVLAQIIAANNEGQDYDSNN